MAKKPDKKKPEAEPERVKFSGSFDELASRVVRQPSGKAPERQTKKRKPRQP